MQNKDNQSKRIYLKATRKWVEVSEEYYRDHTHYYDAFRKRHQSHGQCVCPKNKFWLCDGDCYNCEFRRAGDMLSLDYTMSLPILLLLLKRSSATRPSSTSSLSA